MFSESRIILPVVAGAVAVAFLAVPAAARPPVIVTATDSVPVIHVAFQDLNLAVEQGQRTLATRMRGAARQVCFESGWDEGSRTGSAGLERCRRQAMEVAKPQMQAAVQRAQQLASTGQSLIAAGAITLSSTR